MNVKGLQQVLVLIKYPLVVDGILGPKTIGAFLDLAEEVPIAAKELLELCGIKGPIWISKSDIHIAIDERVELSVPESFLRLCVDYENTSLGDGYIVEYVPPFVGLGQFNKQTWDAVSSAPFSEAHDLELTINAICNLYLRNKQNFMSAFPDLTYTDEIAYLYHNQGAGAAQQFITSGILRYPKQSAKALSLFARI